MKTVTSLLLVFMYPFILAAQGVFSNNTNTALQEVIEDYPNHFSHIKGDLIAARPRVSDYRSKVEIPGAISCVITEYGAPKSDLYNWQCELYTVKTFAEAEEKFKTSYEQIGNMIIKVDDKAFIINGKYEAPSEERKITAVHFNMLPSPENYHRLKIVLSLEHAHEWRILLSVYDQERMQERRSMALQ